MGQIYGIKNLLTNQVVYVGQTIRTYKIRWQQHKQQSKDRKYSLYNAFNKYGINNFKPFLIEECENTLLNEREQYWIKYYKTYIDENGYNLTKGGNFVSDKQKIPVHQYDLEGNFIQSFDSMREAQRCVANNNGSSISKVINNKENSAYGFLWSLDKKDKIMPLDKKYRQDIYQYDKNMNFIKKYKSVRDAAKALGKPPANISACALKKRKTAYGYIWSYDMY